MQYGSGGTQMSAAVSLYKSETNRPAPFRSQILNPSGNSKTGSPLFEELLSFSSPTLSESNRPEPSISRRDRDDSRSDAVSDSARDSKDDSPAPSKTESARADASESKDDDSRDVETTQDVNQLDGTEVLGVVNTVNQAIDAEGAQASAVSLATTGADGEHAVAPENTTVGDSLEDASVSGSVDGIEGESQVDGADATSPDPDAAAAVATGNSAVEETAIGSGNAPAEGTSRANATQSESDSEASSDSETLEDSLASEENRSENPSDLEAVDSEQSSSDELVNKPADSSVAQEESAEDSGSSETVGYSDPEDSERAEQGDEQKWYQRDSTTETDAAFVEQSDALANNGEQTSELDETVAQSPPTQASQQTQPAVDANAGDSVQPGVTDSTAANAASSSGATDSTSPLALDGGGKTEGENARIFTQVSSDSQGRAEPRQARGAATGGQGTEVFKASDVNQQDRLRLIQRVSRSFARLGPDGGNIQLKLHPPQLGSLAVQVRMEGRSMTAKLTTESSAAREVILESLPILRGRLAEQGFEISQFQVEVADNGADASFGQGDGQEAFAQNDGETRQQRTWAPRFSQSSARDHLESQLSDSRNISSSGVDLPSDRIDLQA